MKDDDLLRDEFRMIMDGVQRDPRTLAMGVYNGNGVWFSVWKRKKVDAYPGDPRELPVGVPLILYAENGRGKFMEWSEAERAGGLPPREER